MYAIYDKIELSVDGGSKLELYIPKMKNVAAFYEHTTPLSKSSEEEVQIEPVDLVNLLTAISEHDCVKKINEKAKKLLLDKGLTPMSAKTADEVRKNKLYLYNIGIGAPLEMLKEIKIDEDDAIVEFKAQCIVESLKEMIRNSVGLEFTTFFDSHLISEFGYKMYVTFLSTEDMEDKVEYMTEEFRTENMKVRQSFSVLLESLILNVCNYSLIERNVDLTPNSMDEYSILVMLRAFLDGTTSMSDLLDIVTCFGKSNTVEELSLVMETLEINKDDLADGYYIKLYCDDAQDDMVKITFNKDKDAETYSVEGHVNMSDKPKIITWSYLKLGKLVYNRTSVSAEESMALVYDFKMALVRNDPDSTVLQNLAGKIGELFKSFAKMNPMELYIGLNILKLNITKEQRYKPDLVLISDLLCIMGNTATTIHT